MGRAPGTCASNNDQRVVNLTSHRARVVILRGVFSRTFIATFGVTLSLAYAARADRAPTFPRALVKAEDIESAITVEWNLRKHYEVLPSSDEPWFAVLDGTSKVLI